MKQVSTYSANQLSGDKPVEGLTLIINKPLPKGLTLDEWQVMLDSEAEKVTEVLIQAMPQGLTDRIACKLMSRMVTSFSIPLGTK